MRIELRRTPAKRVSLPTEIPRIRIGDLVQLRKAHPCGGDQWTITRTGADIGMKCTTCGRRVMLDRLIYERRLRKVIEEGPGTALVADAPPSQP
ncbi:MAG: DUF951 domain-containing protein [Chloroflexi bacterium]|nr:DUF951 domain-containing protein [Chloroflexota bacterium]